MQAEILNAHILNLSFLLEDPLFLEEVWHAGSLSFLTIVYWIDSPTLYIGIVQFQF